MSAHNTGERKRKRKSSNTALKVVIWIVVIAAVLFASLILAYRIAGFDSLADMINFIFSSN